MKRRKENKIQHPRPWVQSGGGISDSGGGDSGGDKSDGDESDGAEGDAGGGESDGVGGGGVPFYYVSNSEVSRKRGGGVYTLEIDANGNIVDYFVVMTNTSKNCGGGRTPWNSWYVSAFLLFYDNRYLIDLYLVLVCVCVRVCNQSPFVPCTTLTCLLFLMHNNRVSCEEDEEVGYVWQVDPAGIRQAQKTTLVDYVGDWESFAYYLDIKHQRIEFFVTHDSPNGALVRYVPKGISGNKNTKN